MARDVGDWTRDKLKLLQLYLPGYLQATTKARDRIYIDGFAGPGRNQLRSSRAVIDGSPLIALDASSMSTGVRFTRLFFIEQDPDHARELQKILDERGERRAEVVIGDVNEALPRIVQALHPDAPTFVFLDTEGIDPRWSTIEGIAAWRTELLINFPLGMAINRNAASAKVEAYFGTPAWKALWDRGDIRGLLDLYKGRLRELGYTQQARHDRLIARSSGGLGQHYYYLLPSSKREEAIRIWNWVFEQPDANGQSRMKFEI